MSHVIESDDNNLSKLFNDMFPSNQHAIPTKNAIEDEIKSRFPASYHNPKQLRDFANTIQGTMTIIQAHNLPSAQRMSSIKAVSNAYGHGRKQRRKQSRKQSRKRQKRRSKRH